MIINTVTFVLMCALSVAGVVEPQGYYKDAVAFKHDNMPYIEWGDRRMGLAIGMSIGGMLIVNSYTNEVQHEYGSILLEREMGKYYVPVSLAYSTMCYISEILGFKSNYYGLWTEARADELGGVNRGK